MSWRRKSLRKVENRFKMSDKVENRDPVMLERHAGPRGALPAERASQIVIVRAPERRDRRPRRA
jgi:hypothetical protein